MNCRFELREQLWDRTMAIVDTNKRTARTTWLWLLLKILMPFAAAYFLSYLLRNSERHYGSATIH